MGIPTMPEFLRELVVSRLITSADAEKTLTNYEYFEAHRVHLEVTHIGQWVASLNGQFYFADTESALVGLTAGQSDADRAYVAYLGNAW